MLLKGKKVCLRAIEPEDVDRMMKWENDPANWEVSGTIAPYSRSSMESLVRQSDQGVFQSGQLRLMIDEIQTTETIGTLDLFDVDPLHRRAGVGILIAIPEKRRNGLAAESLSLLRDYAFDHLGLHQLYCNVLTDNPASLHLFEKAGFAKTGEFKDWIKRSSCYKNQYFLQLLNDRE